MHEKCSVSTIDSKSSIVLPCESQKNQAESTFVHIPLVLALQLGQVDGICVSNVIQNTSKYQYREVKWRYPDHPVICQVKWHEALNQDPPTIYDIF